MSCGNKEFFGGYCGSCDSDLIYAGLHADKYAAVGAGGQPYSINAKGKYDPVIVQPFHYESGTISGPAGIYIMSSSKPISESGSFTPVEYHDDSTDCALPVEEKESIEDLTDDNQNYTNLISVLNQAKEIIEYGNSALNALEIKTKMLSEKIGRAKNKWTN